MIKEIRISGINSYGEAKDFSVTSDHIDEFVQQLVIDTKNDRLLLLIGNGYFHITKLNEEPLLTDIQDRVDHIFGTHLHLPEVHVL